MLECNMRFRRCRGVGLAKRVTAMKFKAFCVSAAICTFLASRVGQAQDVDVPGNLTMRNSTDTEGNILKGGSPFIHNFGFNNTFVGLGAGNLTMTPAAGGNTAVGVNALSGNATGGGNTASGFFALTRNTDGSANTANGFNALFNNSTGIVNTATGGQALISNTTGGANTAVGFNALFGNTTGGDNTAIGLDALVGNTTGFENTAIGHLANVSMEDLTNATAIGSRAVVDASNKIRLGNANVTVIEGEVGFTSISDRSRQENVLPVDGQEVLAKIRELSLASWNFTGQDPGQFRHYGPAAQDFFAAFGRDGLGNIGTPTTITSTDMDGILMIAAQALEKRASEQAKEIEALKTENAALSARLEALERAVGR